MGRQLPEKAFSKLESIYLYKLNSIEQICNVNIQPIRSRDQLTLHSFRKLKIIKIKICGQLKTVFLSSMVGFLTALETIEVSECNSLKEIVAAEMESDTNKIEFPALRCLTLQSLSELIGFYPTGPPTEEQVSNREPRELFNEQVAIPKLERMELSSIKIQNLWKDQPLPNSYFRNLIRLDVNDCGNLTSLLSFSMAKNLVNLQSLFISECENMDSIFLQGQSSDAEIKDSIFPKLKNIKLNSMKSLRVIWNSKVPIDSCGKLDTLIVEECDKLVNVFSRYMVGIFRSLCNLRVINCKSMKEIFDLDDKNRDAGNVTNLKDVHLEALPKLVHVWKLNNGQEKIFNLENLQKIWIHECDCLENIFPVSLAKFLKNLEHLVVSNCHRLKEIVAKGEGTDTYIRSTMQFVFPKLTTIKFLELQKLKNFYPGEYELSFPALKDLSVDGCDCLEPFRKEVSDAQRNPVLFPEKVLYKLKSMQIELRDAELLRSYSGKYQMDYLEELHLSGLKDTQILNFFLNNNPNLRSLWLSHSNFHKLVPHQGLLAIENLGVVPQLKSLKLICLRYLWEIGFERDAVLQRLECLILNECPELITIAPSSSVSLTHLTILEVVNCKRLINLMAPSTAKSLVQLSTMKVIQCYSLEEIVENSDQANEEEKPITIVFRQLKALELRSLDNLTSFCSSKRVAFELPSLEKLIVSNCPKMEKFAEGATSTPILRKTFVVDRTEDQRWYWEGDLNVTIQKMFNNKNFFEGADKLSVSDHPELKEIWTGNVGVQHNYFYCLETLELDYCEFGPYAIPSNVLPRLKSLKELKVESCSNVKAIFDMTEIEVTTFQLKKLTLGWLQNLTQLWDKNPEAIISFQNLQQLLVSSCNNLKMLFPAALAKNLKKLEKLSVRFCGELQEIVAKEEEEFVFPRLTELDLHALPKLTCFYFGRFTLKCPALNRLDVRDCNKLELFQSQQGAQGVTPISSTQHFFLDLRALSKLEELTLDWRNTSVLIGFGQFPKNEELNRLDLCFDDEVHGESNLPFEILEKAPNLETIIVRNCNLKEMFMFPSQEHRIGENRFCEKLHELQAWSCPHLTIIIHSEVSLSNLKKLMIYECHGLKHLFTSSAAKKLVHLQEMKVRKCESLKEIVAKEQNPTTSEEIKFERLETIALQFLSSLECFYSGNATLQLPSLIRVVIKDCPKMEIFSQGSIHAESFRGIEKPLDSNYGLALQDDLNTSVERVFLQQDHLVLRDSPMLQKIWLKLEPVPERCFCYLKSLVVEGCEFLSNAILPFHLLPFLNNLEELQVRKCNSVQAIFDVKETPTHHTNKIDIGPGSPLRLRLKKLILEELPTLKHVWNEDPQGSLIIPFLREVLVDGCESIRSLFPASVAIDRLQKLDVRNCLGLVEIVAKDDVATEGAIGAFIIFLRLTSLRLWNLPNLKCIYPKMRTREWPKLTHLNVYNCQKLNLFVTDFQNCPDSRLEVQDSLPTDQRPLFSADKVTPHLEELTFNKEDAMMIEQGQLHVDLQKLKFLQLQGFHDESDVFPYVFPSKVTLPSIEKIGVVHSAFKEIFPTQKPNTGYTKILSRLKGLELNNLGMLNSIGLEHSWMGPFLEKLETLKLLACNCLTNLVPSTVSFFHLTVLMVDGCHRLEYLFTSSTAKSLGALEEMHINNCVSLEIIVAGEENELDDEGGEEDEPDDAKEDEAVEDAIIFEELKILSLSSLPRLGSFYTGSSTLNFPYLQEVSFTQCHTMKMFSDGDVVPKQLEGKIDGVHWYGDLNVAVKRHYGEGSSLS